MTNIKPDDLKKVTVQNWRGGKRHRAFIYQFEDGRSNFLLSCGCPGSQTNALRNKCRIVAQGWETTNCKN